MDSDKEIFIINEEQHYVLDRLDDLEGVMFLTGKAGTGKTTLFNLFNKISGKKSVVLAPTGVAAVNIGGQTIHSFFRFPPGIISNKDYKPLRKSFINKIGLIVIDEISMVRADLLDHIDSVLRLSAQNNLPFGGIPMLWIGDLYQLPPIVSTPEEKEYFSKFYESSYFFSSKVMKTLNKFELVELTQIYRQEEQSFIRLLNNIRVNEIDADDLEEINLRNKPVDEENTDPIITLCSTNSIANSINQSELNKIKREVCIFYAKIQGKVPAASYPAEQVLALKIGAQVMSIKNASDKSYVNGSLGIIEEINDDTVLVKFPHSNSLISIGYESWDIVKYKIDSEELTKEIVGNFDQIPLRLAWAITIHKSQGKTFDKVVIDLGRGSFETGQTYVALSRCRTMQGLYLKNKLNWNDIRTDDRVTDFIRSYS